jgi:hypothetical protein
MGSHDRLGHAETNQIMNQKNVQQRDLFTRRWRMQVLPQKEATSLHIPLVSMLRWALRPDCLMRHIPNGEYRDPRSAAKLKAMGTLPGSADLEFHWAEVDELGRKHRRLLHLELKVGNRQRTDSQVAFALAMRLLGDDYEVARSIDETIAILGERGLIRRDVEVCGKRWA